MKSGGVQATNAAKWSGGKGGGSAASQGAGSQKKNDEAYTPPGAADTASFSTLISRGRQGEREAEKEREQGEDELRLLLELAEQSNDRIRLLARNLVPGRADTRAMPSTLGLPLEEATATLKLAGLRVRGVGQTYSARVPEGCVVSQSPQPGSITERGAGVGLTISRGPAPGGAHQAAPPAEADALPGIKRSQEELRRYDQKGNPVGGKGAAVTGEESPAA